MKINKFLEHKNYWTTDMELSDMINGKVNYTSNLNILINDFKGKWYSKIGQYILDTIGIDNLPGNLKILLKNNTTKKKNLKILLNGMSHQENILRLVGTFFMTGSGGLDDKSLDKMFGDPVYHQEFGEGFHGDYDELLDTRHPPTDERKQKNSYASYFLTINGVKTHIGFDHRGTSIEMEQGTTPKNAFNVIKSLIDIYKQEVLNK